MAWIEGIFMLVLGGMLLAICRQGYMRGGLPFGANGLHERFEIRREDNPLGYWIVLTAYVVAACALIVCAIMVMLGRYPALPLQGGVR